MSKSKSIFIVDTPESINGEPPCYYCPLYQTDSDYYYQSYICQNITNEIEDNDNNMWEIYKNCPLKPHQNAIPIEWLHSIMEKQIIFAMNSEMEGTTTVKDGVIHCVSGALACQVLANVIELWEKEKEAEHGKKEN